MTKLASALPDGHGLDAIRRSLLETPRDKHVAIAIVDCARVTVDYEKATREPTAALLRRKDGSPRQHAHNRCPAKTPGHKIEREFVKHMSQREYA